MIVAIDQGYNKFSRIHAKARDNLKKITNQELPQLKYNDISPSNIISSSGQLLETNPNSHSIFKPLSSSGQLLKKLIS